MDKSRRLPPLGAPSSRAPPASKPPYAPLTFLDSQPPRSHSASHPHPLPRSHSRLHPQSLPHPRSQPQPLPSPTTTSTLFSPLTNPLQRSSQPSPPIPINSDSAVSKPKKLHREVEQRRRMRMAEQIAELRQCVSDPNSGKTDKVSILQDAVSFIKSAKRNIISLEYRLQAAESECSRLLAILTEWQSTTPRHQPHHNPHPLPVHPHLQQVPTLAPAVVSTTPHPPKPHAHLLPSNSSLPSPAFNFGSIAPQPSPRETPPAPTATRSSNPTTQVIHSPIALHGTSWNTFSSSAQPFSHAATGATAHPSPHFSHGVHRTHSQPSIMALPQLPGTHRQSQRQSFLAVHTALPYESLRNSLPPSGAPQSSEHHSQQPHQSNLEPTQSPHPHPPSSPSRPLQDTQNTVLTHPADQASMSTPNARHPPQ